MNKRPCPLSAGRTGAAIPAEAALVACLRRRVLRLWIRRLEEMPAVNAMALPATLEHMMPRTLDEFASDLATNRGKGAGRASPPPWPPDCLCGQNPLLAYYMSGSWALEQALFESPCPRVSGARRRGILQRWRAMAAEETTAFCAACRIGRGAGGADCPGAKLSRGLGGLSFEPRIDLDHESGPDGFPCFPRGLGIRATGACRSPGSLTEEDSASNEHTQQRNHGRRPCACRPDPGARF